MAKRWQGAYKRFRDVLSEKEKDYFDLAPDLQDKDFPDAFARTLFAQYVSICGRIDLEKDVSTLKILTARADNLVSQIRMLKVLVSQPGMSGKRPTKVSMSVFEDDPKKPETPGGE